MAAADIGFSAGYADNAEHGEFGQSRTGYVDAVGVGMKIGRRQVQALVH